ncbi:MAG: DNA polymerase II large subunit [Candidatus Woesearchaeota archaeon]
MAQVLTPTMQDYFSRIDAEVKRCYEVAEIARSKGLDPESKVDIPLALDMAERIEGLISAMVPQVLKSGIAQRIRELEVKFGNSDWRVALNIAHETAKQKFCKFKDEKEAMETGIRLGLAYVTLGIISAPLEGFLDINLKDTKDGKKYMAVNYAGPIRASGGTAAAVSVIIADYVRMKMGYAKYDPDENEVKRICTEIDDYHERCSNLQYRPSREEVDFLVRHMPVEIDGDPTEEVEVSNYKDMPRIKSNRVRGGMCLVLAEGVAQKGSKLWGKVSKWGVEMELDWMWLKEFLDLQKLMKAKMSAAPAAAPAPATAGSVEKKDDHPKEKPKIMPNFTFIKDLVAGRPILTFPLAHGGFRLRYGRSRTSGFAAYSIHPATMIVLDKFIATGTQLKVERPGKATVLSPCDTLEGPIVRLNDGSVLRLDSEEDAKKIRKDVDEIIYLGDLLVAYGDFVENNHILVPAGYCEEWYSQELEKAIVNTFGSLDALKLSELTRINLDTVNSLLTKPLATKISIADSITLSKTLNIPLHPVFTLHWNAITLEQFNQLVNHLGNINIVKEEGEIKKLVFPYDASVKRILELVGVPHILANKEFIVIGHDYGTVLLSNLNYTDSFDVSGMIGLINEGAKDTLSVVNKISKIVVRDKSGTFIGARMGRPEKAKMRKMNGSPHTLFSLGEEGGRLKTFQSALEKGKITADFPNFTCPKCNKPTIYPSCETCGTKVKVSYYCRGCDRPIDSPECKQHGKTQAYKKQSIDIKHYFDDAISKLKMPTFPDQIKGVRSTINKDRIPEHLSKGILRAKHNVYVNKDGTTRYDMIQMPVTHFRLKEVRTSVEKLKSMGYINDIHGNPIISDEQVIELKPQDIILPCCPESMEEPADEVLFRIAKFIDDLLQMHYGVAPYYNLKTKEDLIGHFLINLAPHTSAGSISRILGFSKTQGMLCHPLAHAATRRNCDGDEAGVMLLMDGLLNFSRQFLPDKRGGRTMDACLVLTLRIVPTEVDTEVHNVDIAWRYPLELYELALQYKHPSEVKIKQIGQVLGQTEQYEGQGFTHDTSDFNAGVRCSAYKLLPSMQEKLQGQMELARKIRAVDARDVATMVIEKHFIRDIKGNLRKFSEQTFRCVGCNEIYRRPPLLGKCLVCGGKIIFTISEGSIVKYLEPSLELARKYGVHAFLKQSLDLLVRRVEGVFGKDKEKQSGLGKWF